MHTFSMAHQGGLYDLLYGGGFNDSSRHTTASLASRWLSARLAIAVTPKTCVRDQLEHVREG